MIGARAIVPLFCFIAVNAGWSIVASRYDYLVLTRNSSCANAFSNAAAFGKLRTRGLVLRLRSELHKHSNGSCYLY